MILHSIELRNFGLYGGPDSHVFPLTPQAQGGFDRPIVLFYGTNGAGKTSLVEAIRLCLHGSLALGPRVSRASYEQHLLSRIHRSLTPPHASDASVKLTFDYVVGARRVQYVVERSWARLGNKVRERLNLFEDQIRPRDLRPEQYETFLRDLISPDIADIFFFDGERLDKLADDAVSQDLLATTVKSMLGLNLVQQLRTDLDVYLLRNTDTEKHSALHRQQEEALQAQDESVRRLDEVAAALRLNHEEQLRLKRAVTAQEQRIAAEGGQYALRYEELKIRRQRLQVDIEAQRRLVQEACSGLMPFAIAAGTLRSLEQRLKLEQTHERWEAAQGVLQHQMQQLTQGTALTDLWAEAGWAGKPELQHHFLSRLQDTLRQAVPYERAKEGEVILRVSERDRTSLSIWTSRALEEVPQQFAQTVSTYTELEAELKAVEGELSLTPANENLQPLVETLHHLQEKLAELQQQDRELVEQDGSLKFELEQATTVVQRLRSSLLERQSTDVRVNLAIRSQQALEQYAERLAREKLSLMQQTVLRHFNALCRKENLTDAIEIDPETFQITLYRHGVAFGRAQLSAGEKQLLAIAIMWALREVSGMPMPVVIDTPLGRLDAQHRLSMLQNYFPHASHQVLLLATDSEIPAPLLAELAPAVSHAFELRYDARGGCTRVQPLDLEFLPEREVVES